MELFTNFLKNLPVKKLAVWMLTAFFMIGLPLLTLYISETIVRQALDMPFSVWTTEFTKRFALNAIILIAIFNVLYILPRKWFLFTSFSLSCVLVIFAIANSMKIELRNSPISLGDFALLNELRGLENPVDLSMPLIIGGCAVFLAITVGIIWLVPKIKELWWMKAGISLLSMAFLAMLWTGYPFSPMDKVQFQNTWWQQEVGTMRNGLFGNFVLLAQQSNIDPPEGYSENRIESIGNEYVPAGGTAGEKPNVVILMSEAFIDPYHFGAENFTEDPIPNFRQLYEESLHGTMYSPEFGGGTANVEFEALTGLSRQFMPASSVAYQLYVKKPLPSAAYAFKAAGYETTAIHSYFGWYYQRESVYRLLGFNQFISGEFMDLDHALGSGWGFPKDHNITNSVLETLDATEGKDFVHAVAVEGHQPYQPQEDSPFVKSGELPDITRQYLNKFTDKMNSVDKEIGRLVEELEKRSEPTILIFFGDHYPTFGNNDQVYGAEGTQVANNMLGDYEDFINTHNVPYFIWNSEGNEPEELDLSPNQFGAIALEMAGVEGNAVTAILDDMRAKGDAVIPYNQWQQQMGAQTEEMEDLHQLQYDLLHGSRHVEQAIPGLIDAPAENYHLGLVSDMEIQEITSLGNAYEILAEGVPKFTKLLSEDDTELVAEWNELGNGLSSFTVNKSDVEAGEKFRFALYDSLDNILRSTDYFEIAEAP
ncbi:phosphoglycerol transferase MdoB-like AlkP superfamily enzyme [Planomicrobium stackebrandtii]|uniref:Phosphoglycerol transferase MdoB-like AlkP superfamily enzyme n=1 Tax=Planomicrobium stackebrandtii TaxID=253160 RepID=A0ABU0GWB9_9BACL|nr:LTA synthase family protein [Planomicrobium stackebrandtii]MDQ0428845.1 phosphoglycerol transferase MdoB-like AlkP superfamily enzyme [Planomicrobium stackebrandtii]